MSAYDKLKLFYAEGQVFEKDMESNERLMGFRKDVRMEIECQAVKKFMDPAEEQVKASEESKAGEDLVTQASLESQIEKYVKLESNKKATISTIGKLIKFTKEKDACYLCKQGVTNE